MATTIVCLGYTGIMEEKMESPSDGESNGKSKWKMTWKLWASRVGSLGGGFLYRTVTPDHKPCLKCSPEVNEYPPKKTLTTIVVSIFFSIIPILSQYAITVVIFLPGCKCHLRLVLHHRGVVCATQIPKLETCAS